MDRMVPRISSPACITSLLIKTITINKTGPEKINIRVVLLLNKRNLQLIRFARVSSYVADFNARNKSLTAKLLQQGYRYHKLRKTFSKFYRRHYELVSKFNVGLKTLLHQGLSEPDFYHACQSLACETAINTNFSELFSLKRIYVKYENVILSPIDGFFRTWND